MDAEAVEIVRDVEWETVADLERRKVMGTRTGRWHLREAEVLVLVVLVLAVGDWVRMRIVGVYLDDDATQYVSP
jgi:hypothetical protein